MSAQKVLSKSAQLNENWKFVIESDKFQDIENQYKKRDLGILLENAGTNHIKVLPGLVARGYHHYLNEEFLRENTVGAIGPNALSGIGAPGIQSGGLAGFDPILMPMIRRTAPNLVAYDICGVQPMQSPTSLIFALKAHYGSDRTGPEALYNEPDPNFSSNAGDYDQSANAVTPLGGVANHNNPGDGSNPGLLNTNGTYEFGRSGNVAQDEAQTGITRNQAEILTLAGGDNAFREMSFSIEKTNVEARTRALAATFTIELQQDLMAIHGIDAQSELMNLLSSEILAEINRQIVRVVYTVAKPGAQGNNITTAGTWSIENDSNGRWQMEQIKGLLLQIFFDCNAIARETRRGKGNFVIASDDVVAALAAEKLLDYHSGLSPGPNGYPNLADVDATGNLFMGTLDGRIKVYVDPFAANYSDKQFYVAGYKGTNPYDAGLFYCPYIPLEFFQALQPDEFQPRIGFKTRYGLVSNPFVRTGGNQLSGSPDGQRLTPNSNQYYRRVLIDSLR